MKLKNVRIGQRIYIIGVGVCVKLFSNVKVVKTEELVKLSDDTEVVHV